RPFDVRHPGLPHARRGRAVEAARPDRAPAPVDAGQPPVECGRRGPRGSRNRRRNRQRSRTGRGGHAGAGRDAGALCPDGPRGPGGGAMSSTPVTMTYREACRQALRDALQADPRCFVMGEDVGRYGGCYAVTKGLLEEFGPMRVRDTPLAESAFVGAGIGAALAGMRPIVEIMTCNFSLLALDQILNNAATISHMSGGQF